MSADLRQRIERRLNPKAIPFRLRSTEPTRTEALTDAVVGFSMTLAVVSLDVPADSTALLMSMREFGTFLLTFAVLFWIWYVHQQFSRRYGLEDDHTIRISGAILFMVVFYTFPLKFVVSWLIDKRLGLAGPVVHEDDLLWIVGLYGLGYGVICGLFGALHRHALGLKDLLQLDEGEELETRLLVRGYAASVAAGIPLAISPALIFLPRRSLIFAVAGIFYIVLLLVGLGYSVWQMWRIQQERAAFLARTAAAPAREPA